MPIKKGAHILPTNRPQTAYPSYRPLSRTDRLNRRREEGERERTRRTPHAPLAQPHLLALDRLRRRVDDRQAGRGGFTSTAKEILDLLRQGIPFDAAWIVKLNRQNLRFAKVHLHQFSRTAFSEYLRSYPTVLPTPRQLKSEGLVSQKRSDLTDEKSWHSGLFYRTLLEPLGLDSFLIGLCVDSQKNEIGLVCLWRSPDRRDFNDSDLLFLERASADLATLLKGRRERRRADRTIAVPAAKKHAPGIFVLGNRNELVFMNEEAQALLTFIRERDPSPESGGRPFFSRLHQVREKVLKQYLLMGPERSELWGSGPTSLDHLFTFRGISFSCRGTVLEGGASNSGLVLILVEAAERSENRPPPSETSTGDEDDPGEFGLTRQEVAVARLITRGLTNKEIASELGISVHTIKGHLKQVMRKLEVTTRSAITTRMMTR